MSIIYTRRAHTDRTPRLNVQRLSSKSPRGKSRIDEAAFIRIREGVTEILDQKYRQTIRALERQIESAKCLSDAVETWLTDKNAILTKRLCAYKVPLCAQ